MRIDKNEYGCSECGETESTTVLLGEDPPGYGVQTAWVCGACLEKALQLLKEAESEGKA
jgi:hypothetical protein